MKLSANAIFRMEIEKTYSIENPLRVIITVITLSGKAEEDFKPSLLFIFEILKNGSAMIVFLYTVPETVSFSEAIEEIYQIIPAI